MYFFLSLFGCFVRSWRLVGHIGLFNVRLKCMEEGGLGANGEVVLSLLLHKLHAGRQVRKARSGSLHCA